MRIRNDGAVPLRLRLAVTGPGHPYSYLAPDTMTVAAGAEALARVTFTIPRAPEPAAGPLRFTITLAPSGPAPEGTVPVATAAGAVDVAPFTNLSAMLSAAATAVARDGPARHDLVVANQGNAPASAALRARADPAQVGVRVDPPTVLVAGGGEATATVEVAPARRRLTGGEETHDFRVVVEPEAGQPFEVAGSYRQRPAVAHPVAWATAVVAVLGLITAGVVLASGNERSRPAADPVARGAPPLESCPARGHTDMFGIRSIEPDETARLPDSYTFLRAGADGCTPARLNPCEPVHYIQNDAAAPPFVADNVREAFRRLSRVTGITFVDEGTTDETFARASPYVPERYGPRWAPILIMWEHFPAAQTSGRSQILGNTLIAREGDVVVSGRLRFNVDAYGNETTQAPIRAGFGPPTGTGSGPILRENITWGRVILHELAHVVGLGHTRDTASLMYPDAAQHTGRPADFMPLDIEGLRYLGKEAGCLSTPPPRAGGG